MDGVDGLKVDGKGNSTRSIFEIDYSNFELNGIYAQDNGASVSYYRASLYQILDSGKERLIDDTGNVYTKTLTVGTHIASRTDAKAVKVLVAVYDSNGVLMGVKAENVFFDTNEVKDLSVAVENVEYPFDAIKVFVWDFDWEKMLPLAVVV